MNKELLATGNKTEEGRLKIKKIRKLNIEKRIDSGLRFAAVFTSLFSFLSGIYLFMLGARDRFGSNNNYLDYIIGIIAMAASFLLAIGVSEISEDIKDKQEEIALLEDEILSLKKVK